MPRNQTRRQKQKPVVDDVDFVVVPAEIRRDCGTGHAWGKGLSTEDQRARDYAPTTLVMTFPAGELAELRRLIWGDR